MCLSSAQSQVQSLSEPVGSMVMWKRVRGKGTLCLSPTVRITCIHILKSVLLTHSFAQRLSFLADAKMFLYNGAVLLHRAKIIKQIS